MIKNLQVTNKSGHRIDKITLHKIVGELRLLLGFELTSLQIIFLEEEKIEQINSKYLGHNYSTDIISFNYSNELTSLDGELYICPVVAINNAKKYRAVFDEEIYRLVIHGILHLLGYNDINKKDRAVMKREENRLLKKIIYKIKEIC